MRILIASIGALALAACGSTPTQEQDLPDTDTAAMALDTAAEMAKTDPHLWLEEVEGEKALAWVRTQNERSLAELKADSRYAGFEAAALDVATSKERIPYGSIRDGMVYNFWQDETNTRGLWRRTTQASYVTDSPRWETILDFDKLSADESKNWVYKGVECYEPKDGPTELCLISLSDGGKDAIILREFNMRTKTFVENGFTTDIESRQYAVWTSKDEVLISAKWDEASMTDSDYPFIVKRWTRGTPMSAADEVFRGAKTDVGVFPYTLELSDGTVVQAAVQSPSFFSSDNYWIKPDGTTVKMPVPQKSSIEGIYQDKMLITLEEDWSPAGEAGGMQWTSGDLVAMDIKGFLAGDKVPATELVFRPSETQAVNGVGIAKGAALLSINENVVGKVLRLERSKGEGWTTRPVNLPGTGQAGIAFADKKSSTVFLNYEGFLTPDSLLKYDTATNAVSPLKSLPAKFNADGLTVQQFFATSSDGEKIPYFVIHREDIAMDGTTPTLLYGYGGFQISLNPSYSATTGRLWLEQGGAYVLANIRGGGEFGPDWHQAGLKTKRQLIYDDFIAVGEELIAKKITSPEHLGIMGGSNGGLLMGVMLNQRPDLWNAVVVQVPLLDMLRYHTLLAGASWMDEYGDPDVAEERAFLETISPYQNFDAGKDYPTPFFVTSTKDDRVHPGHARKMAAKFEAAGLPFLYYENIDGGHSAAANQKERAKRSALEFTYLADRLGLE